MINWNNIFKHKLFIAYAFAVIGFFYYSGLIGWLWFNPTETQSTRTGTGRGAYHIYRLNHK